MTDKISIELKRYNLTKNEYIRVCSNINNKRYKWLVRALFLFLAGIALLIIWGASKGIHAELIEAWLPVVIMSFMYWWIIIWGIPIFVTKLKLNRHLFQAYQCLLEEGYLIAEREDGALEKFPLDKIVKVDIVLEYYILYTNAFYAYFIPFSSFHTVEDKNKFEQQLILYGNLIPKG
ncbi:MAG: YcxB family protein [Candidatus Parabeggiatoa sp.]|nr:YcxB family protein [Candidatus Parabeggiatoa sp.]